MSIESPMEVGSPFSQEDIDTAKDMVKNDPILSQDTYAKEVVLNEGLLGTGEYVKDLGNFLSARKEAIESGQTSAKFEANVDNMVVGSERADMEVKD